MLATAEKPCDNVEIKDTANPKTGCFTVRYAEHSDLPQVLVMYMAALKELKSSILEPDLEKCADEVLFSWSQAPCILIEKLGEIVGFAGLKTVIPAYTKQNVISEYMLFVWPKYRSIKVAKMLSDECQKVSDRFGIPLFFTHFLNGLGVDHKTKFLKRWGYNPLGVYCTYGVNNG